MGLFKKSKSSDEIESYQTTQYARQEVTSSTPSVKHECDPILNEFNTLLTEILMVNFKHTSISGAARNLIDILNKYYHTDYITIFLFNNRKGIMGTLATNIDSLYVPSIEEYVNKTYQTMNSLSRVAISESSLPYPSAIDRGVKFSNLTLLEYENKLIGSVLLENKDITGLSDATVRKELYDKLFLSTSLVLANLLNIENLVAMTSTDQLTGVYNRRYLDMNLEEQIKAHMDLGLSFTLAIFDIDHFKKFNDTYGHQFGDLVLHDVAQYVSDTLLGDSEWIARYGGEEFVIFLGRSEVETANKRIEGIRRGIESLQLTDGNVTSSVTASFGVVSFPFIAKTASELIAIADKALYHSKQRGRNRVTVVNVSKS